MLWQWVKKNWWCVSFAAITALVSYTRRHRLADEPRHSTHKRVLHISTTLHCISISGRVRIKQHFLQGIFFRLILTNDIFRAVSASHLCKRPGPLRVSARIILFQKHTLECNEFFRGAFDVVHYLLYEPLLTEAEKQQTKCVLMYERYTTRRSLLMRFEANRAWAKSASI